ncbi:uncharacterized protein LOC128616784 [Ictalurus furcatus]|uniref:uncharacterized protein LOC128616784 n=1 Tax=Ictalurus furcatus TaxID=66913 RepID=UPI00235070EE|nr:uncharacterized protein LOC128616784 [Ictalurus furcatus]
MFVDYVLDHVVDLSACLSSNKTLVLNCDCIRLLFRSVTSRDRIFRRTMDAARGRERSRATMRVAGQYRLGETLGLLAAFFFSVQFPQRYDVELPQIPAGLGSYPLEFLFSCQEYFSSLAYPKPSKRQWIGFMVSRFCGPARDWAEQLVSAGSPALHDVSQFSELFMEEFSQPGQLRGLDLLGWRVNGQPQADPPFNLYYEGIDRAASTKPLKPPVSEVQVKSPVSEVQVKSPVPEIQVKSQVPEVQVKSPVSDIQVKSQVPELQVKSPVSDIQVKSQVPEVQVKSQVPDVTPKSTDTADHVLLKPKSTDPVAQVQPTPESADLVAQVQLTPESADPVAQVQLTPESADTHSQVLLTPESADTHSQVLLTPESADTHSQVLLTPESTDTATQDPPLPKVHLVTSEP